MSMIRIDSLRNRVLKPQSGNKKNAIISAIHIFIMLMLKIKTIEKKIPN